MNSKKPKTPSKDELLSELESIRSFLNDGEAVDDAIPTLTAVADDPNVSTMASALTNTSLDETNDLVEIGLTEIVAASEETSRPEPASSLENDFEGEAAKEPIQEADHSAGGNGNELQIPPLDAYDSEYLSNSNEELLSQEQNESPSKPEDQQTSLFAEEQVQAHATPKKSKNRRVKAAQHRELDAMPKARGDNPFLPPHIRERLGRHRELFESMPEDIVRAMAQKGTVEVQGDLLSGFDLGSDLHHALDNLDLSSPTKTIDKLGRPSAELRREALIDELVAEYLPLIEAKLRAKLREASFKDD